MNLAMPIERHRHLGAQAYERSPERSGYANGYKPKKIDTATGTLSVQVPKSRAGETPFYPQALERGRHSSRAVMLAIAQMDVQGAATRDVEKVMAEFGREDLSAAQLSRAAALMDEEREAWRRRRVGAFPYLFLDARYEKARIDGPDRHQVGPRRRQSLGCRHWRGPQAACSRGLRRPLRARGPLARFSRRPHGARPARRAMGLCS